MRSLPTFTGRNAQVLDFVVRRYESHRYNVDAVVAMIVVCHDLRGCTNGAYSPIHKTRLKFLLLVKAQDTPLAIDE